MDISDGVSIAMALRVCGWVDFAVVLKTWEGEGSEVDSLYREAAGSG
jgi:hypothetical protein